MCILRNGDSIGRGERRLKMEESGKERRGENAALPYSVARSLACHVGFTGSSAQLNGLSYITSSQRGNRVKKRIDKQTSSTRNGPYLGKRWCILFFKLRVGPLPRPRPSHYNETLYRSNRPTW